MYLGKLQSDHKRILSAGPAFSSSSHALMSTRKLICVVKPLKFHPKRWFLSSSFSLDSQICRLFKSSKSATRINADFLRFLNYQKLFTILILLFCHGQRICHYASLTCTICRFWPRTVWQCLWMPSCTTRCLSSSSSLLSLSPTYILLKSQILEPFYDFQGWECIKKQTKSTKEESDFGGKDSKW